MFVKVPFRNKYKKKGAFKIKQFDPASEQLTIDLSDLELNSASLVFVDSKRDYKKALKGDDNFVLYSKKNVIIYNENGRDKGIGKGGAIVRFKKGLTIDDRSVVLTGTGSDDSTQSSGPEPTPAPVPTQTPTPAPTQTAIATALSRQTIYGDISYRGEEDLYELDVPEGHQVFLKTTGDVQSYVLVVDADGNELSSGGVFDTTTYIKGKEDIYAKVIAYGGQTGDYELQYDSDLGDELKIRSAPVLGQNPPSGSLYYKYGTYYIQMDDAREGEIEYDGEADFFKLEVRPGNVVSLTLNTVEDGVYPYVSLVDSQGDVLKEGFLKGGSYEVFIEEGQSGSRTSSSFSGLGPYDVVTGQTDLYAMVEFSGGTGSYSLNYEIYDSPSDVLDTIASLVNEERAKVGAQVLTRNNTLDRASFVHSQDMLKYDFQSHTGSNGSSPSDRAKGQGHSGYVGENIHTTHGAFNAMQAWMNSYGHRQNLLNSDHVEMGFGYDSLNDLDNGKWTQLFA